MAPNFHSLKRWLPATGLVLAVASAALAQTAMKRGQSIFFSSSDSDEVVTDLPSLTARSPSPSDFAEAVQAPKFNFNPLPNAASLSAPSAPLVVPPANDQMNRLREDRQNWMLLTPNEILGLYAPGKNSRVTERDAAGGAKHMTAAERFLQREDSRRVASTNGFFNYNPATRWNFINDQRLQMNPAFLKPGKGEAQNAASPSQFFSDTADVPAVSSQNAGQSTVVAWPKLFATPVSSAPTATQKADMDEFRKLLHPLSPPDATTKVQPSVFGLPPMQTTLGSASKSQGADSIGASLTPLDNGIAKPVGTASWPTLINQKSPALISLEPEWKPQLPPWMQPGPQPGVIPQRKF